MVHRLGFSRDQRGVHSPDDRLGAGPLPSGFDGEAARSLLAFGLPLAGSSILVFLMVNVDYVVVGRLLGSEALGFYLLAFNLCSWPVALISVAVRRVSLAGFSRIADEPWRAGAAFSRAAGLIMAVTLPLCAVLAGYAPAVITFLYGEKWIPSADALRLLCVLGAARVAVELSYDYLVAVGRTTSNFAVQVLWLLLLVPALVVGANRGGILGVAAGHAVIAGLVIGPVYAVALRRANVSLRSLAREEHATGPGRSARLRCGTARPLGCRWRLRPARGGGSDDGCPRRQRSRPSLAQGAGCSGRRTAGRHCTLSRSAMSALAERIRGSRTARSAAVGSGVSDGKATLDDAALLAAAEDAAADVKRVAGLASPMVAVVLPLSTDAVVMLLAAILGEYSVCFVDPSGPAERRGRS